MDRVRYVPLAMGGVLAAYLAVSAAGVAGLVVVLVAAALAGALVLWMRSPTLAVDADLVERIATGALLLVPAVLSLGLSFSGGGFYPDSVALGVIALAAILMVRCATASAPLRGMGPWVLVPGAALVVLGAWTLLSALWSDAPGLAVMEFERVALYTLAFLVFGSLGRSGQHLSLAVGAIAAAFVLVAAAAFLSRAMPDVLKTPPGFRADRLSYPLGYWNTLGLCCAVGVVFAVHLTASLREPRLVRVLAAGALPLVATTLLLTYSRAGVAAAAAGVALYVVIARPRGLVTAALAAGPATAIALASGYDATLLSSDDPTSPGAVAEGHDVARVVAICVVAALAMRAALLVADARVARIRFPARARRPATVAMWTAAVLAAAVGAVAVDAPAEVRDRYEQFVNDASPNSDVTRERLSSTSNAGRLALWRAALDGFEENRLTGTGAGTFGWVWMQYRSTPSYSVNAHGVYQETLAELGIVGAVLLLVAIVAILVGLAPVRRGRDREIYALVFVCALVTAAHAAIDWDWEMPAAMLWMFALAGLALGRATAASKPRALRGAGLGAIGLLALGLVMLSGAVLASQTRLDASVAALDNDDCPRALAEARSATDVLPVRAEPREVVGVCLASAGRYRAAAAALEEALARDSRNWALHYSLATVLAAAGESPRAELRRAQALNPSLARDGQGIPELSARNRATRRAAGRDIAEELPLSGRW